MPGEVPPANRRGCEQYTHKHSTYRVAQHDHISSREHAWFKIRISHLCVLEIIVIHVPHLTLTTSTSSLSPTSSTSPLFPTVPPSQTSPVILNHYVPCDGPRHKIPSLTKTGESTRENSTQESQMDQETMPRETFSAKGAKKDQTSSSLVRLRREGRLVPSSESHS